MSTVFAFTPPFTQLNTPYPATAYLKGFLNTKNISCTHADLGLEVILNVYSKKGFEDLFDFINKLPHTNSFSDNAKRIIALQDSYISSIDAVISFLQGKNPTYGYLISQYFLPTASRFDQIKTYMSKTFGSMATQDQAKHLATLYLEDISDLIKECVDPHFGFSRYAERLGRSANSFDELHAELQKPLTYIDQLLITILSDKINLVSPKLVAISVPFPGNLYTAFRSAQWIKKHYPSVLITMGGGFPNTELRSLSDARVFQYFDFITLDDGELPLECLINFIHSELPIEQSELKRTFVCIEGKVQYINNCSKNDYPQAQTGTPDYSDLLLHEYISVLEIVNPMHRLWSDGRWNKLTMAHGCYWGKCTFCDITLDYIKVYEPLAASQLCDRMETIMQQTGQNGFHFVDEAAPPARMKALALEILRRKLSVNWWTNIRFEKSFTADLCRLLKASGCIAVSGGLEVASDRLLALIQKGVTVAQVAQVCKNFKDAGILVHAYLMYGYPTQTTQETIDSLEMVRQMFEHTILKSAYWHRFAMTVHSPVGIDPAKFKVKRINEAIGTFANNDLEFSDPVGTDHEAFDFGLKKSLLNYMHGMCIDYRLQEWFDFKIPKPKVAQDYIQKIIQQKDTNPIAPSARLVWIAPPVPVEVKKEVDGEWHYFTIHEKKESILLKIDKRKGEWLHSLLNMITPMQEPITLANTKEMYDSAGLIRFEEFWNSPYMNQIRKYGMVII